MQPSRSGGLTAEVVRIAFQEAMQARLDAFLAGERVYDEMVRAAEARSEEIVAEARAEAGRIVAKARAEAEKTLVEAARQARALHDEAIRQARETDLALAELRSQRSHRIRRLYSRLTGDTEEAGDPSAGPGPAPGGAGDHATEPGAVGAEPREKPAPTLASLGIPSVEAGSSDDRQREKAEPPRDGAWTVPDWLR